jgi:hypothetical protein
MAISDSLRKYLNGATAKHLLASNDVTNFLLNSFTLVSDSDYKELVQLLMLKYDDIFGEIETLIPGMFLGTQLLDNVSLSGNIDIIPSQCFENSGITSVDANNVKTVASKAFFDCTNLETVNLPNVEIIGTAAFARCLQLKKFDLPKSVKKIGSKAFSECSSLEKIYYHGTKEEAAAINFGPMWDGSYNSSNITIVCTDGEL